ncbi:hypothetical protein OF83DRAFT_1180723 [Amylostereum chailletii]|nr:hypothetical protein OF83DRAFT_1180723 [Amylostereum chailletii]
MSCSAATSAAPEVLAPPAPGSSFTLQWPTTLTVVNTDSWPHSPSSVSTSPTVPSTPCSTFDSEGSKNRSSLLNTPLTPHSALSSPSGAWPVIPIPFATLPLYLSFVSSRLAEELDPGSLHWNESSFNMLDSSHSPPISVQPLRPSASIVSRPPTPMGEDSQVEELWQTVPKSRVVQSKRMSADKRCLSALDGCRTRRRGGCEEFLLTVFSAKASKGTCKHARNFLKSRQMAALLNLWMGDRDAQELLEWIKENLADTVSEVVSTPCINSVRNLSKYEAEVTHSPQILCIVANVLVNRNCCQTPVVVEISSA